MRFLFAAAVVIFATLSFADNCTDVTSEGCGKCVQTDDGETGKKCQWFFEYKTGTSSCLIATNAPNESVTVTDVTVPRCTCSDDVSPPNADADFDPASLCLAIGAGNVNFKCHMCNNACGYVDEQNTEAAKTAGCITKETIPSNALGRVVLSRRSIGHTCGVLFLLLITAKNIGM